MQVFPWTMKRTLSFLLVFLLSAQCSVGSVAGDLSLLTDAGQTDSLDRPLVLFSELNDGSVLTVDDEGNVSLNAFTNGVLSTQWSVLLEVEANNARIDAAQELVTVAHDQGVYVVQMSTQSVYWNVSSVDRVDDAVIDNEGELWLAFFACKRRADQYDTTGYTGISSTTISAGISSLEILNDGRLVMASYDKKIYVHATDGSLSTTLTEPNGIVSYMEQTDNSTLLAGTTGGTIYHYEIDTWTASSLGLGHTKQTTLLAAHNSMYIAGSKQGKVAFIDQSNPVSYTHLTLPTTD